MKAIVVHQCGGPEQLHFQDTAAPNAGPGQALVRVTHAGVNFIDIYFRMGLYKADLPMILGMEAAGVVESVGEGVTEVAPGDRVALVVTQPLTTDEPWQALAPGELRAFQGGPDMPMSVAESVRNSARMEVERGGGPMGSRCGCAAAAAVDGQGAHLFARSLRVVDDTPS
jgi:threonine dehydrogenase-like Zn-dependent dehydrogenase